MDLSAVQRCFVFLAEVKAWSGFLWWSPTWVSSERFLSRFTSPRWWAFRHFGLGSSVDLLPPVSDWESCWKSGLLSSCKSTPLAKSLKQWVLPEQAPNQTSQFSKRAKILNRRSVFHKWFCITYESRGLYIYIPHKMRDEICTTSPSKCVIYLRFPIVYLTACSQLLGASRGKFCCETRKEVNVPERVAGLLYEERLVGGFGTGVGKNRGWKW